MSKAILVMDMPESCLKCPLLNGSDECTVQDEDVNFHADTWDKLKEGCPLRELPETAFEEIQQYKALGTVEELKQLKENGAFTGLELAQIAAQLAELKKYKAIGTIEECREAREKTKPKKANRFKKKGEAFYQCGVCGRDIFSDNDKYCAICGQAIDWSEEE